MNDEQKAVAEKMIHILQKKDGQFELASTSIPQTEIGLSGLDPRDYKFYFQKIRTELIEDGYLKKVNDTYYRLTRDGIKFISFEDLEQKERQAEKISRLRNDQLELDVKRLKKASRQSFWALIISAIAVIVSILQFIHNFFKK